MTANIHLFLKNKNKISFFSQIIYHFHLNIAVNNRLRATKKNNGHKKTRAFHNTPVLEKIYKGS